MNSKTSFIRKRMQPKQKVGLICVDGKIFAVTQDGTKSFKKFLENLSENDIVGICVKSTIFACNRNEEKKEELQKKTRDMFAEHLMCRYGDLYGRYQTLDENHQKLVEHSLQQSRENERLQAEIYRLNMYNTQLVQQQMQPVAKRTFPVPDSERKSKRAKR